VEELKSKFEALSEDDKIDFMKMIMPSMCQMIKSNSQKTMADMIPFCKELMKECNMDMSQMMSIMINN